MFRKNYSSNDLHAFRGKLDSILIEIGAEKVEDMLEPAYSRLSEVFIRAREKVFYSMVEKRLLPPQSSDYIIQSGKEYTVDMQNSSQLFYMKGIYKDRNYNSDKLYFGLKTKGRVIPAAYIKESPSGFSKAYLNYDVIKEVDKKTFKKLLVATGFELAKYKNSE